MERPTGIYKTKKIIINFDTLEIQTYMSGCFWWLYGGRARWVGVSPGYLELSDENPHELTFGMEKHSLEELGLTQKEISVGFGVTRRDVPAWNRIWQDEKSLKGDRVAFDFEGYGVALSEWEVLPFTGIDAVMDNDHISEKYPHDFERVIHSTAGLSVDASQLAQRLGVPLLRYDPANEARLVRDRITEYLPSKLVRGILENSKKPKAWRQEEVNGRYYDSFSIEDLALMVKAGFLTQGWQITEEGEKFLSEN